MFALCMYLCVYACIHVCMYECMSETMTTEIHIHRYKHKNKYKYPQIYVFDMCKHVHLITYATRPCIYTHTCIHAHIYTCPYIHAHTMHTHSLAAFTHVTIYTLHVHTRSCTHRHSSHLSIASTSSSSSLTMRTVLHFMYAFATFTSVNMWSPMYTISCHTSTRVCMQIFTHMHRCMHNICV